MLSRCMSWLRSRGAAVAIVIVVPGFVAGCATVPSSTAPSAAARAEVVAAREVDFDLLPAFEMPEPTSVPAPATVAPTTLAPTTLAPATLAPATVPDSSAPGPTADEDLSVVGDPRGAETMALIAYPWRRTLPGWSIAFLSARAGLRGLTRVDERRIEIYRRDGDSASSLARVVAHELGHAVDVELNSPSDRERWRTVRGVAPSVSWWPGNAVSDFDTLAGDFAEAFATMLTGSVSMSRVAPPPGPAELAVLAELATR
jgi:hypothetical protein